MFQSQDDTVRASRLRELTTNQESHWGGDSDNQTKIRQSNLNDQKAFQEAIRSHYSDRQIRPSSISQAYRYLKILAEDWLDSEPESRTTKADALEATLTEYLEMAVIDLDEDEKPHIIFETLNARGEPLKQSDLIKNTVMYEANVIDQDQTAQELWGMFDTEWWREDTSESRLSRIHIDRFLHYWMIMRTTNDVTESNVASEFRRFVAENDQLSIETIAAEIRNAGSVYRDVERGTFPGIETFLVRIKVMEVSVVIPLVMWLCTSNVTPERRRRSIEALESYLVRRMLSGFQTQGLNKVFISLLRELHANGSRLHYHTNFLDVDNRVWPSDLRLSNVLLMAQCVAKRRKMILVAVEI